MSADDDVPVGYGKPPVKHRIKPNEVRNPWGRKGKPRQKTDFLNAPFALKMDGKSMIVTRDEAIDFSLFNQTLAGKVSAAKELARRQRERMLAAKDEPVAEDLAAEDRAAFDRHVERLLQDRQADRDPETGTPSYSQPLKKGRRG